MVGVVSLVDLTITKREKCFTVDGCVDGSNNVIWLDNRVIVVNCDLALLSVALESVWNEFRSNTLNLVVLVHGCVLVPECFLRDGW
jgi:hypothetical protein